MIEPKLIYHLTDAEYHRRMAKAWREGYAAGYALDEIAPLVPQVPKAEIAALIRQHDKETRL